MAGGKRAAVRLNRKDAKMLRSERKAFYRREEEGAETEFGAGLAESYIRLISRPIDRSCEPGFGGHLV